jgi:hypothetical protein
MILNYVHLSKLEALCTKTACSSVYGLHLEAAPTKSPQPSSAGTQVPNFQTLSKFFLSSLSRNERQHCLSAAAVHLYTANYRFSPHGNFTVFRHDISPSQSNLTANPAMCEISNFHGGKFEDVCLLGRCVV